MREPTPILIVEHLTAHGAMEPALLYESPFTAVNPLGPDGLFDAAQIERLVDTLNAVRGRAIA